MAGTLSNRYNFLDLVSAKAGNGDYIKVAETLDKEYSLISILPKVQANNGNVTTFQVRNDRPEVKRGIIGDFDPITKGSRASKTVGVRKYSAVQEIVREEYEASPNADTYLSDEAESYMQKMRESLESDFFYSKGQIAGTADIGFVGLSNILNDVSDDRVESATTSGNDDLSSIYFVIPGSDRVFSTYPERFPAGIDVKTTDWERQEGTTIDGDAGVREVKSKTFRMFAGLCVKDPRSIARLANIDTDDKTTLTYDQVTKVLDVVMRPSDAMKAHMFMSQTVKHMFRLDANEKTNANFEGTDSAGKVYGKPVDLFAGQIPMHISESILDAEERVA